jgi:putative DNA primase/helicase
MASIDVQRINDGWRVEVGEVTLDAEHPRCDRGAIHAVLTVSNHAAIHYRDTVNFTSERARTQLLKKLAEKGVVLPEEPLIALDQACRTPSTPPPEDHEERAGETGAVATDGMASLRKRFRVDAEGVWYTPPRNEDGQPPDVWVCAPLHIVAATRDVDNNHHGHLLEFHDRHGHPQQWAMPLELLEDQREYRKVLRRLGLSMNSAARAELQLYLEVWHAEARARCVDRVGWYGHAYVFPDGTLGDTGGERLVLQTLDHKSEGYRQAGTLEGWQHKIATRCVGNSRLLVAVSTGFAAPLLEPLGEESGGLHFRGISSEGKTTALLIAATVWGEPGRIERWRSTANALEGVALAHNHNVLCLDELKEVDPREAGGVAYMLANGTGKRRGQPHGGTRPRLTWRLLFLSTGEISLEQHMAEAGQRIQAGQEVRLVDIPADAGAGYGLFEDLHGTTSSKAFADQLREATAEHYGHAGRAFVTALSQDRTGNAANARRLRDGFVAQQVPTGASGQVFRVAQRFGLIGAAGELATAAGITGWPEGAALEAAARCFQDWLRQRGGVGNAEEARALSQVRLYFERFGEARFKPWTVGSGDTCERCRGIGKVEYSYMGGKCFDCYGSGTITSETEPNRPIYQRAGFRRATQDGRTEYYVLPEVFHKEMAQGFDAQELVKVLLKYDLLYRARDGKPQCSRRLPGMGVKRVYHFKADILGEAGGDDSTGC